MQFANATICLDVSWVHCQGEGTDATKFLVDNLNVVLAVKLTFLNIVFLRPELKATTCKYACLNQFAGTNTKVAIHHINLEVNTLLVAGNTHIAISTVDASANNVIAVVKQIEFDILTVQELHRYSLRQNHLAERFAIFIDNSAFSIENDGCA